MRSRSVIAVFVTIALSVALCPSLAFAATLTTGSQGKAELKETATKTVYVLTKEVQKVDGRTMTHKYAYNKSGLLAKMTYDKSKRTYSYNRAGNLVKEVASPYKATWAYKLNSKGKISQCTWTMKGSSSDKVVSSATYKSGKVTKVKSTTYYRINGKKHTTTSTRKYSYKNGRVSKSSAGKGSASTFKYDKRGNICKKTGTGANVGIYVNTYDANGNLGWRVISDANSTETITYTYKAIKVSSKYAAKVKQQQWALLNENLNFVLGLS